MNPTSNKKDFKDLSTSLKDLAYSYIEKYSPSKQQLRVYLMKKTLTKFKTSKFIKSSIEKIKNKEIEPDFVSALRLCKRRRIGALRPDANREIFYKKDMGVLARAGFDYDLSKRVLNLDKEEFNILIKII